MFEEVKEFSEKFGCFENKTPGFLPDDQMKNRLDFQMEELLETAHAAGFYFNSDSMEFRRMHSEAGRNLPDVLDGLVDQFYVLGGTILAMGFLHGFVFERALARVHMSNMEKIKIPGTWKIQKQAGWKRPELVDLVQ